MMKCTPNYIPNSTLFTSLIEHVCHPFVFESCEQSVTVHPVAVHHVLCVWSSHDLCAVSRVWEFCASICPSVCVCCLIQFLNSQAERVKWVVSNFSARANSKAGVRDQINQHTLTHIYVSHLHCGATSSQVYNVLDAGV